jgi:hypothetical protein
VKVLTLLFAALLFVGCGSKPAAPAAPKAETPVENPAQPASPDEVSFARDIQSVFAASCMPCHSGAPDAKSKYTLPGYNDVMGTGEDSVPNVLAGNADNSVLYKMLKSGRMPPNGPLSKETVELLKKWINQGAKDN